MENISRSRCRIRQEQQSKQSLPARSQVEIPFFRIIRQVGRECGRCHRHVRTDREAPDTHGRVQEHSSTHTPIIRTCRRRVPVLVVVVVIVQAVRAAISVQEIYTARCRCVRHCVGRRVRGERRQTRSGIRCGGIRRNGRQGVCGRYITRITHNLRNKIASGTSPAGSQVITSNSGINIAC